MIDTTFFPGAKKYWHMGKLYSWDSIDLHVMSHALHYGTSVFEGIRAYDTERGPAIFRLKEHMDRFFHSAEVVDMNVPYTQEEVVEAVKLVLKENRLRSAYIRPLLYYGYGNLGLVPKASPVKLVIGCWGWGAYLGDEAIENGVHVLLLPWKRIHPSQVDVTAKLGGLYVQSSIAGSYARKQGYDEGLFLNWEGRVAEGPGENLIIIKDEVIKTNDWRESILEGITRTTVLELARDLGYRIEVAPITLEEFLNADEAFFTGTAAEVTPVTRMTDGRDASTAKSDWPVYQIGAGRPGKITRQLAKLYGEVVRGKHLQYNHWLTYIYKNAEAARQALERVEEARVPKF